MNDDIIFPKDNTSPGKMSRPEKKSYPALNRGPKSLFSNVDQAVLQTSLIVKYDDLNGYYKFTTFENPWSLYKRIFALPESRRTFFEVVTNLTCRKPHFDLDMILDRPQDCLEVVDEVLRACRVVIESSGHSNVNLEEDAVVLKSHGWKGQGVYKVSFHIILDNWYLQDNLHAKRFCQLVLDEMKEYHEYIDDKIYSSIRQFRLFGNHKFGSNRFLEHENRRGLKGAPFVLFRSSLISLTGHCRKIQVKVEEKKVIESFELRSDQVAEAFRLFKALVPEADSFSVRETNDSLIILDRLTPSHCILCPGSVHQAENPYLLVRPSGEILYNCRRSSKMYPLGEMDLDSDDENEMEEDLYFSNDLEPVVEAKPKLTCSFVLESQEESDELF